MLEKICIGLMLGSLIGIGLHAILHSAMPADLKFLLGIGFIGFSGLLANIFLWD